MRRSRVCLITGGAGFIGSHLVDRALEVGHTVVVLDRLSYAGSMDNLQAARVHPQFSFVQGDISDRALVAKLIREHNVDKIFHLAAESHVDNSISGPTPFIETNIIGTFVMLEAAREAWVERGRPDDFRFVHVSTDEVYGELGPEDPPFSERTAYAPNSPYSASKAASDHLARAWHRTYGVPVIITNCSNNFGPRQHAEKLIPTIVRCAIEGHPLPVYGDGSNIRDWLYVKEHCRGLLAAAERGRAGESYCFGGDNEIANIDLVRAICRILDQIAPRTDGLGYDRQISFVNDRPGHDWRYAIDFSKASRECGYRNETPFATALEETVSALAQSCEPAETEFSR